MISLRLSSCLGSQQFTKAASLKLVQPPNRIESLSEDQLLSGKERISVALTGYLIA